MASTQHCRPHYSRRSTDPCRQGTRHFKSNARLIALVVTDTAQSDVSGILRKAVFTITGTDGASSYMGNKMAPDKPKNALPRARTLCGLADRNSSDAGLNRVHAMLRFLRRYAIVLATLLCVCWSDLLQGASAATSTSRALNTVDGHSISVSELEDVLTGNKLLTLDEQLKYIIVTPSNYNYNALFQNLNQLCQLNMDSDIIHTYGVDIAASTATRNAFHDFELKLCFRMIYHAIPKVYRSDGDLNDQETVTVANAIKCGYDDRTHYSRFVLASVVLGAFEVEKQESFFCDAERQGTQYSSMNDNIVTNPINMIYYIDAFKSRGTAATPDD